MDPINLTLRVGRLPAASAPVGGELSAAEVDANFENLRTACEQLDTEKVSEASLAPVTEVASAQNTDLLLMERSGAPVKAPVSTLPQPAPVATAVRDALQSLAGANRLDASAIQNLPSGPGGGISDAPSDGMDYARRDAAWQMLPKFITQVKLADESRANNTYAADDTLQATLEANSIYRLELMLRFRGGVAEDFRFRINRTGLSDAELRFAGDLDNNSAPTLTWSSALNCAVAAASTNYIGNYLGMVITGADPGTLIVEWAQQVTGATAATLAAGSMLMLRQVYREPPDTVPAAMTIGQWSLTPIAGGFRINVGELPADGGQPISDIQGLIEGGSWTSLGGATLGDYDVTGLPQVELDVQLRTVNSVGPSLPSDTKTDTPLAAGGSGFTIVQSPTRIVEPYTLTIQQPLTAVGSGNHLLMTLIAVTAAGVPTWSDSEGGTPTPTLLHSYVADSHTHRFYSLPNVTNGATWIRATFGSDTEAYLKVTEVAGPTPALDGSGNGESQGTASQWDHAFTSAANNAVFLGCASFTNGATATGVSPVSTDCTAEWHANSVGLFPTAGANTASFTLAEGRGGYKSWICVGGA